MAKENTIRKNSVKKEAGISDFERPKKIEKEEKISRKGIWKWLLLKDERARQVLGGFFILFSLFLAVSFISHIFNWQADQSLVNDENPDSLFLENPKVANNLLGYLGAYFSDLFLYRWIGISSFLWLFWGLIFGIKLTLKKELFPLTNLFTSFFFATVFISIFASFIFSQSLFFLGGGFGFYANIWLKNLMGNVGIAIFLFFYASVYFILVYNFNVYHWALSKKDELQKETIHDLSELNNDINDDEKAPWENPTEEDIELKIYQHRDEILADENPIEEIKTEEISPSPDTEVESPVLIADNNSDLQLEVVQHKEETPVQNAPKHGDHIGLDVSFDPTLELSGYKFPTSALLKEYEQKKQDVTPEELNNNKQMIEQTLKNYNVEISKITATIGPTVTLYEIVPAPGVRISKIKSLEDDIALSLAALGIRIIAPIPGKGTIGIEVPNKHPEMVAMQTVINHPKFVNSDYDLPIILGKTITNELFVADLAKMPHLLMAGATGQGKSVGINTILVSLLYRIHPSRLKFVLVDPKKVELTLYREIENHFLAKIPGESDAIITENKKVINTLNSLCVEMDLRYKLLQDAGVRHLKEYNKKFAERKLNPNEGHRFLPYIVVVIDEMADLMMTAGKEVEHPIGRLAQLARAIGIHLIIATQRPSVNVITGTIKANFPARIAFRVTSKIDSRTILDSGGADQLIGRGDMLYSSGSEIIRLQCPFVDTPEVENITQFIGNQRGFGSALILPEIADENSDGAGYEEIDANDRDAMFEDAARLVVLHQQGSTSLIQRRLKLGYNRAGRIIDQLERAGIVGPFEGSKARQVLMPTEEALERHLKSSTNKD